MQNAPTKFGRTIRWLIIVWKGWELQLHTYKDAGDLSYPGCLYFPVWKRPNLFAIKVC